MEDWLFNEDDHIENEKLITMEPNGAVIFNKVENILQSLDFIICFNRDFMIKVNGDVDFIVEFELDRAKES